MKKYIKNLVESLFDEDDDVTLLGVEDDVLDIQYRHFPKTKDELQGIIREKIKTYGYKCSLNDICTNDITDMSYLFISPDLKKFNGDISRWDVSNVTNMARMFESTQFNGNISLWDVSNVTNMSRMFQNSVFTGDISYWDVSNVTNMSGMFKWNKSFNSDISKWNVSNVTDFSGMFMHCVEFNQDISSWNICTTKDVNMEYMLDMAIKFNLPIQKWDMSHVVNVDHLLGGNYVIKQDFSNWDLRHAQGLAQMLDSRNKSKKPRIMTPWDLLMLMYKLNIKQYNFSESEITLSLEVTDYYDIKNIKVNMESNYITDDDINTHNWLFIEDFLDVTIGNSSMGFSNIEDVDAQMNIIDVLKTPDISHIIKAENVYPPMDMLIKNQIGIYIQHTNKNASYKQVLLDLGMSKEEVIKYIPWNTLTQYIDNLKNFFKNNK